MADWAGHGYDRSHSRWYWGLKLYLLACPDGMPVAWCLANPTNGEREVAEGLLDRAARQCILRLGMVVVRWRGPSRSDAANLSFLRASGYRFARWRHAPALHMAYHMPMARREVLVQLDDDLVGRLDALAERAGTSRSELLRRGALAVLQAAELAEADQQLVEAYRRQPQDPAIVTAAARLAAENAPAW